MSRPPTPQAEQAAHLRRELDALDGWLDSLARELSPTQLAWRPPEGGWSVGQVLEHLVQSNEIYEPAIRVGIAQASQDTAPSPWKPSFFGRLLMKGVSPKNTRRLKAPSKMAPPLDARRDVVEALRNSHRALRAYLDETATISWNRARVRSPAIRFLTLNLGDVFTVAVLHEQRHQGQIARVRSSPGFPR